MFQVSVARLYEDNREKLGLSCLGGTTDALVARDGDDNAALIGYLNFTHPNRVQVVGPQEIAYLAELEQSVRVRLLDSVSRRGAAAFLMCEDAVPPSDLARVAQSAAIPILSTAAPGSHVIEVLRRYLSKNTAATVQRHGVCMDVLGLGVLITGDSGVGKS
jgi:HPr kinase/phosphorylase